MGRKPEKEVVRWLTSEELNEEIRKRKICSEVLRKLFFIKELYKEPQYQKPKEPQYQKPKEPQYQKPKEPQYQKQQERWE